ncbi:nitroreductase [Kutzneria sp. 744]|nr:nitroreductase [Kutzneria sp. 744]
MASVVGVDNDELLSTTRSVRLKLDLERPVEPEVINDCLRLALQAPSPGNLQMWRWIVVRDANKRAELGRLFREAGNEYLASLPGDIPEHSLRSGRFLIDNIERVPVFVIPCVLGRPPATVFESSAFWGGIYPAVWSLQLALRTRGLGSTMTTYHLTREAEAREILGIPEDVTQTCLLPIAYTTQTTFKPAQRRPLSEVAYTDRWDG